MPYKAFLSSDLARRSGRHNHFVDGTFSSKWRNRFSVKKFGREELLADLDELKEKVLGCWCSPKNCHGDVLCELVNKLNLE